LKHANIRDSVHFLSKINYLGAYQHCSSMSPPSSSILQLLWIFLTDYLLLQVMVSPPKVNCYNYWHTQTTEHKYS